MSLRSSKRRKSEYVSGEEDSDARVSSSRPRSTSHSATKRHDGSFWNNSSSERPRPPHPISPRRMESFAPRAAAAIVPEAMNWRREVGMEAAYPTAGQLDSHYRRASIEPASSRV